MTNQHHPGSDAPRQALNQTLRQARAALEQQHPPAYVQRTVLAALAPRAKSAPAGWFEQRVLGWIVADGQVRHARVAAFALALGTLATGLALVVGPAAHSGARAVTQQVATAFIPLVSSERMGAQNLAWVVATDVPRGNLAALGLPYDPARVGEPVRAEMLVNPTGEVLAVRFLQ